ncbi:MAG: lipoprotein-releasing ABC transporter permease subunit [Desulfobacterota bacterium]|nr:lipoprotein-releasing ABC transporter permease subunit [Thermodesulfobacteriota bacterium]
MNVPYEVFIAFRYLRAKRKQAFISVITGISIAGVGIGVMALILVLGVMTGFTSDLREKILGTNSHIVISAPGTMLRDYRSIMNQISTVPDVIASTPFIICQVMLSSGSSVSGAVLRGIDITTAPQVIDLPKTLVEGSLELLEQETQSAEGEKLPGIIVGKELSRLLGIYPGSPVTVISPTGLLSPTGMTPRWKKFIVVGIFESGMYEYDTSIAYISNANAQQFLKMADEVSGIEIRVRDIYKTAGVVSAIQQRVGPALQVRDWKEMHRNLYSALQLEKTAMFVILTLIILVAAFSIVATLIMMVTEKHKEIAILKAMGATSGAIQRIFMLQGVVIGCIGTLLGLGMGFLLAFIQNRYQIVSLSKDVYYIPALTVKISALDVTWVAVCAVLISFLATMYPSRQAAALDPAEALRYE